MFKFPYNFQCPETLRQGLHPEYDRGIVKSNAAIPRSSAA